MKKSFMTRVLAVSLSAAMAFSVSSASNLMTASAASTVNLKTTFKTLKVNQKYQLKLTNNTLNWKITKVTTSNKKICAVYDKKASSVMLKGKGVGRAKIKVKVKTTKRKYPKNIKYMTCTANVKAADETKPPVEAAFSATVAPISSTQVRVTFNKAVDNASEAANFTVSDGVKVTKSDPSEDKLSTVLTIDGAVAGKSYDLTAKGLTVNGAAQADLTLKFTAPSDVQTGYEMTITSDPKIIKSDGQTQARVTFEVTKDGKAITDQTAQIEFSASRGRFADNRATLNNGKVTVMYNAPHETVSVPAVIQATVVESSDRDMIGTTGTTSVTLSPNPDALTSEAAIITSASAGTADRVVAYFDKEVSAADFMKDGRPDKTKFDCVVRSGIDSFTGADGVGTTHEVIAILDVPNEPKALEILVDTPMTDNSNVSVRFKDKRKNGSNIDTTNTVYLKLADAREPSAMAVETEGTKTIKVTFSEAVMASTFGGTGRTYAADNIDNYLIDGRPLKDYGVVQEKSGRDDEAESTESSDIKKTSEKTVEEEESFTSKDGKVRIGIYSVDKKVGTDKRHEVTITVGSGSPLATGSHILTVRNVGDWAAKTDGARNSVSTQTFPFTIAEDATKPAFTVDVQSPEQYELNFTTDFRITDSGDHFTTDNSAIDRESVLKLQENINGTWTDISTTDATKNNPIRVTKVDGKKYIVEVTKDWSQVYDYKGTRTNYWNKQLRLHVDAGKLVNVSNNLRNDAIDIYLNANDANVTNGNKMGEVDTQSPTIVDVTQAVAKNGTLLHSWNVELSEPVKISRDANREGLTPSQTQEEGIRTDAERENQGIPVPYAQFINVDNPTTVIEGIIEDDFFIDAQDKTINVAPERNLTGGSWRLVVGSISDDYGATLATDSKVIEIDSQTVSTDFKVVWAAVANRESYKDANIGNTQDGSDQGAFVFVKFNKPVDRATALDENNYTLNNQPLPHGSYIQANIKDYDDHDNVLDSVTIKLPSFASNLTGNYTVSTQNTQLSISGVVAAGTGEALSNVGMNRLPYNFGEKPKTENQYGTGNDSYNDAKDAKYDAVWGNHEDEQPGKFKTVKEYYEALKKALEDDQYRKVIINQSIFVGAEDSDEFKAAKEVFGKNRVLTINRAVDIDLNNNTFDGNIAVSTTDAVGLMRIMNGTITGNAALNGKNNATLTVDAGSVKDFTLVDVDVLRGNNDRAINLNNVWAESFVLDEKSTVVGDIFVSDTDGFGFFNQSVWAGNLVINSNGVINLRGSFDGANITVKQAATLNLGIVGSDGNVANEDNHINISNATITVEGSEAKVMLTNATNYAPNQKPVIIAAAKDVKIYAANKDVAAKFNDTSILKKNKSGNFIEVDKNGKKVTTANALFSTIKDGEIQAIHIQKVFDSLVLVEDNDLSYTEFTTVTGCGLKAGVLNKANLQTEVRDAAKAIIAADDELKGKIDSADIKVSCRLNSNAAMLSETTDEITVKKGLDISKVEAGKTDTITITLTYDNYSYTKTIKVTNR